MKMQPLTLTIGRNATLMIDFSTLDEETLGILKESSVIFSIINFMKEEIITKEINVDLGFVEITAKEMSLLSMQKYYYDIKMVNENGVYALVDLSEIILMESSK